MNIEQHQKIIELILAFLGSGCFCILMWLNLAYTK